MLCHEDLAGLESLDLARKPGNWVQLLRRVRRRFPRLHLAAAPARRKYFDQRPMFALTKCARIQARALYISQSCVQAKAS
jgi:hypothetical protein